MKWPNRDVIVGYLGAGLIEERPTDEWLYAFIGRNLEPPSLQTVAGCLRCLLRRVLPAFEQYVGGGADIVHAAWSPL